MSIADDIGPIKLFYQKTKRKKNDDLQPLNEVYCSNELVKI